MHELSITRLIAAPPERVWHVMTDRIDDWWCPRPWRAERTESDRRPGGACNMVMYGPDGEVMPQEGIYLAWDEGRRFATTDAVKGDLEPAGPFMIGIWEIAPEGDGTRYTPARGTGPKRRATNTPRWGSKRDGWRRRTSSPNCASATPRPRTPATV